MKSTLPVGTYLPEIRYTVYRFLAGKVLTCTTGSSMILICKKSYVLAEPEDSESVIIKKFTTIQSITIKYFNQARRKIEDYNLYFSFEVTNASLCTNRHIYNIPAKYHNYIFCIKF